MITSPRLFLLAAFGISSILRVQAAAAEPNLSKTFSVQPGGTLVIEADRGPIQITTGPGREVKIDVTREVTGASGAKADEILANHEVTFEQRGEKVEVHARMKKQPASDGWFGSHPNLEVMYKVVVPSEFNLELQTAAGSITCGDIKGKIRARTSGGNLGFAGIDGPFEGTTSAGSITLAKATGPVTLKTSGGSIKAGELGDPAALQTAAGSITVKTAHGKLSARTSGGSIDAGELEGLAELQTAAGSISIKTAQANTEAKTSGGNIKIEKAAAAVVASTAAGSISASFIAQPKDDCRLTTSGGNIRLKIADGVGFNLDAKASGGRITTDVPVTTTVVGEHNRGELKGKLNGGGKALVLHTSAGGIKIEKP